MKKKDFFKNIKQVIHFYPQGFLDVSFLWDFLHNCIDLGVHLGKTSKAHSLEQ